jgi:hypothetical protein
MINLYYSPRNENFSLLVHIKFLNSFLISSKKKLKNLLVRTKFYWSWTGEPVIFARTNIKLSIKNFEILINCII